MLRQHPSRRLVTSVTLVLSAFLHVSIAGAQVGEATAGIARVGTFPSVSGPVSRFGLLLEGAFRGAVAPRIRLGGEAVGLIFYRNQSFAAPCPSGGPCNTAIYADRFGGLLGTAVSGQFDVDSQGRFFLTAGAGGGALFLDLPRARALISAGAGMTLPINGRVVGLVKAEWLELLSNPDGPSRFVPVSFGVRF